MSDVSQGQGWWQASDGKWYPPERHAQYPPPPPGLPGSYPPGAFYPAQPNYGPVVQSRTNGKAIASLVLSLVWVAGLTSILAVIFGFVARREIRESNRTQTGDGLATAGIVIGFVGIAGIVLFIALVAALGHTVVNSLRVVADCNADATSVQTAADAYHDQIGSWPPSVVALTLTVNGAGPWLREVPSSSNYTIFVSSTDGSVYVYAPNTPRPSSFSASNSYTNGPGVCSTYAQP